MVIVFLLSPPLTCILSHQSQVESNFTFTVHFFSYFTLSYCHSKLDFIILKLFLCNTHPMLQFPVPYPVSFFHKPRTFFLKKDFIMSHCQASTFLVKLITWLAIDWKPTIQPHLQTHNSLHLRCSIYKLLTDFQIHMTIFLCAYCSLCLELHSPRQ